MAASLVAQLAAALASAAAQQSSLDAVSWISRLEAGVLLVPQPVARPSRVAVRKMTEVRVHGLSPMHPAQVTNLELISSAHHGCRTSE